MAERLKALNNDTKIKGEGVFMEKKDFVETLWKYFELHSNQRMQMMNFYIILESLFFTGLFALFTADKEMKILESCVCFAIIFFSWIFYGFDKRTRDMIHNCEESIKCIENEYRGKFGLKIMVFTTEEEMTNEKRHDSKIMFTYTTLLIIEYWVFSIAATVILVYIWK